MRLSVPAATAGLVLVVGLSACSSTDTTTQNEQYCTSATTLQTELTELTTMVAGGEATVNDVEKQVTAVESAYRTALDQAEDVPDAVRSEIQSAYATFVKAVNAIPGTATVAEAADAYKAAVVAYEAELAKIRTEVGCK
ncbi:MAG: hypothetical protein WCF04_00965 [Candidatus Nanopelagicales bacterium]